MTAREAWRTAYRLKRGGLKDAALWAAILEATGETGRFGGRWSIRIQACLAAQDRTPDSLAVTVLNRWGTRSGWRAPIDMRSMRFEMWRRQTAKVDALYRRLLAAGRLELDAGNWVRSVRR